MKIIAGDTTIRADDSYQFFYLGKIGFHVADNNGEIEVCFVDAVISFKDGIVHAEPRTCPTCGHGVSP